MVYFLFNSLNFGGRSECHAPRFIVNCAMIFLEIAPPPPPNIKHLPPPMLLINCKKQFEKTFIYYIYKQQICCNYIPVFLGFCHL